jgi:hypothetical protein
VALSATGTLELATSPQVFRHFAIMSNELNNPKILVCPADSKRKAARDFARLSNTNLSYFIGLDADESDPQRLLSGDRNIIGGTLSNGFLRLLATNSVVGWTRELHNNVGNVGLSDGSVQQMTSAKLSDQLHAQSIPIVRLAVP